MLVLGVTAAPTYIDQRRRARIVFRKRLILAAHQLRRLARQHPLEMPARQAVLAFEEERPRQLQAHAHQAGPVHQDGAKRGYGLVQQGGLLFPLRCG